MEHVLISRFGGGGGAQVGKVTISQCFYRVKAQAKKLWLNVGGGGGGYSGGRDGGMINTKYHLFCIMQYLIIVVICIYKIMYCS